MGHLFALPSFDFLAFALSRSLACYFHSFLNLALTRNYTERPKPEVYIRAWNPRVMQSRPRLFWKYTNIKEKVLEKKANCVLST